jgi:hypothetical protein
MQGFEESSVLISTDGLGYRVEKPVEKPAANAAPTLSEEDALFGVSSSELMSRAERRRREMEAERAGMASLGMTGNGVFASDDLDAAAEAQAAAAAGGARAKLSLREQLALNAAEKDAAWKAKHNPYRPPPGLNDEEYAAYQELEAAKRTKHEQTRQQEQQDFTLFQIALQQKELAALQAKEQQEAAAAGDAKKQAAAAAPVGSAVPLPELDQLDPSLSFSHLADSSTDAEQAAARSSGAAALLSPEPPHSSAGAAATAAASSSIVAPAAATLPPVMLLLKPKRRHSTTHTADGTSDEKEGPAAKKQKKHRKDKEKDKEKNAAVASAAAAPAASAAPAPAANPILAGLGAYGSDDDD